jgi:hypothetical protein
MKFARFFSLVVLISIFAFSTLSFAGVPQMINYQGKLTTPSGALIDSTLSMVFTLYHGQGDASPAWAETLVVLVEKGIFSVVLGNVHAIPYDIFDGAVKYLGVKAGNDPEMSPRKEVVSVGYAFKSEYSDTANYAKDAPGADCGWVDDGSVVRLETGTDRVGIGTSTHPAKLSAMTSAGASENEMAGYFKSTVGDNGIAIGVYGYAQVGTGGTAYGVVGTASGGDSAWAGHFTGDVHASGDVGIGTETPSSKLDVNGDINTSDSYEIGGNSVLSVPGNNTFVGVYAGVNNGGKNNTFLGKYAGYSNTGYYNTFVGESAGRSSNEGHYNTFVGEYAGGSNIEGDKNTFLGSFAGYSNTEGNQNTFLGNYAGYNNTTGESNIFIGFMAGYWHKHGSNKLIIANAPTTSDILIFGDFSTDRVGINTTGPAYTLDVNGDINVNGSYNIKKGGVNYTHPDYVFEPDYQLLPLNELKKYVFENKSLPNVTSAEEVKKNDGFKMDELLIQMLEKIEEQTLYIFELEERIAELEKDKR